MARGAFLIAALLGALLVAGCAASSGSTRSAPELPRDARATLRAFFDAWQAEDEAALEALQAPERRGVTWEFGKVARVEFGEIAGAPELEDEYWAQGSVAPGVERDDLVVLRADATFYFEPGQQGSVADGETQEWMWILLRDDAGTWRVYDWGY